MCNFVNCIEHVQKKEQGEPPEDSEDFTPPFTFTWELQMIFDRTMKHLRHTSFRITELEIASVDAVCICPIYANSPAGDRGQDQGSC